jgi:hypothetical protein
MTILTTVGYMAGERYVVFLSTVLEIVIWG